VDFDSVFDDVYPKLHRYCLRMTADSDIAEDAAQEAFVRLLDHKVRGELPGIRAWLFKVATHILRDRGKVESNRARLLEANPVRPESRETPAEELERKERVRRVREALETLDERDRTLLLMREEGFSYRELAGAIGVQASSVGTLLSRARTRFEAAMNSELVE
jgi:RNA polymerase sigma factor (sigma-70 family)